MAQTDVETILYPVDPLAELYAIHGSKDVMTQFAASQLVASLIEFGVSPADVEYHLVETAKLVQSAKKVIKE